MEFKSISKRKDVTKFFIDLKINAGVLIYPESDNRNNYKSLVSNFFRLGELLGFTWEQIEEAYVKKNAENHERQESGY